MEATKEKIDKLNLIKIKTFLLQKAPPKSEQNKS